MLAAGFLSIQVGAYYAGNHPFHADLGGLALEAWLVAALAMGALLLLRDSAPGIAAIGALLSILSSPSGLLLAALVALGGLATHAPENRRAVVRGSLALAALLVIYAAALAVYTVTTGIFDEMIGEWWRKYLVGRTIFGANPPGPVLGALGWWALLAGGVPAAGVLATAFQKDRIVRWLGLIVVLWLVLVVPSARKRIHEFLPVALIPMMISLRVVAGRSGRVANLAVPAALTLSAAASIALCRPQGSAPYVADREFGQRTLFLAGSERQAVEFSRILHSRFGALRNWTPGSPWTLARHTWVAYADRGFEPRADHEFFVGQGPPPLSGLEEVACVAGPDGRPVHWWARDESLLHEWERRAHARRTDASRFDFEMVRSGTP
jgi:hypothetical protein